MRPRDYCTSNRYEGVWHQTGNIKYEPISVNLARLMGEKPDADEEIVASNVTKMIIENGITDFEPIGTKNRYENNSIVGKKEVYRTDIYVDHRTGKVLAVGDKNSIDQEIVYGEWTTELELRATINHPESANDTEDTPCSLSLLGPKDLNGGDRIPLDFILKPAALLTLKASLEAANESDAAS